MACLLATRYDASGTNRRQERRQSQHVQVLRLRSFALTHLQVHTQQFLEPLQRALGHHLLLHRQLHLRVLLLSPPLLLRLALLLLALPLISRSCPHLIPVGQLVGQVVHGAVAALTHRKTTLLTVLHRHVPQATPHFRGSRLLEILVAHATLRKVGMIERLCPLLEHALCGARQLLQNLHVHLHRVRIAWVTRLSRGNRLTCLGELLACCQAVPCFLR